MGLSLRSYLARTVHSLVGSRLWTKVIVRADFEKVEAIRDRSSSDLWTNWLYLRVNGDVLHLFVFPGNMLVTEIANTLSTYYWLQWKEYRDPNYNIPVSYVLPTLEQKIKAFTESNLRDLGTLHVAILGYAQCLFPSQKWYDNFSETSCNDIFVWKRFTTRNGVRIAFIASKHAISGDSVADMVRALQKLCKVKTIIYLGFVRSLCEDHIPNAVLATGNCSNIRGHLLSWKDPIQLALYMARLENDPLLENLHMLMRYGVHHHLPSALHATTAWVKSHSSYHWADSDIGEAALAAFEGDTAFGYLAVVAENIITHKGPPLVMDDKELRKRDIIIQATRSVLKIFLRRCLTIPREHLMWSDIMDTS
ncbi:hypothetical protein B0O99DRAFT_625818 [Bisporella sp. PMI_857]|nr:hypothetical protein B0O99DRAFT_625818 [Bisporella sp. PMI_857]